MWVNMKQNELKNECFLLISYPWVFSSLAHQWQYGCFTRIYIYDMGWLVLNAFEEKTQCFKYDYISYIKTNLTC